uniref:Uncharacterized protein n=1 Tax=Lepeophtheirus salmonis TaxID=72036 RepID=A0A0K2TC51_LEPSM
MDLRGLALAVFFNSSRFSLPFLLEPFFLSNVSELLMVHMVVLETPNCLECANGNSSIPFKSHFLDL